MSCARLCLAAVEAARTNLTPQEGPPELSLYEAAFLAGGPQRVTELTLVSMHRRRTLLLAHTGWATVVDPEGEDDLERSVISAIGPAGQARIAAVRATAAATDAVRALAERLVAAGLAVPETARSHVASAVRGVQGATVLILVLATAAVLTLPQEQGAGSGLVLAWFALPLMLTGGSLVVARIEVHPSARWASPDGQRLLSSFSPDDSLTAVALSGVWAIDDPDLRAALSHSRTHSRTAHRSD
ncbi:TIGR04222 domain-containing membrane protein [Streptomyces sp. NPDC052236]|uniref:TIGR04222 domain-containing membrane protein n=1 Tax=Streptomyces sp. NPDC052236 TaxID=3365686 RepID=UPI0037D4127A